MSKPKFKVLVIGSGGRVLGVTAAGETLEEAINQAYLAVDRINFKGKYFRGHRRQSIEGLSNPQGACYWQAPFSLLTLVNTSFNITRRE